MKRNRTFWQIALFLCTAVLLCGIWMLSASAETIALSTADDILELMNDNTRWAAGCEYILTGDIDLSDYTGSLTQQPIGNDSAYFFATFDGAGYEISGINILFQPHL